MHVYTVQGFSIGKFNSGCGDSQTRPPRPEADKGRPKPKTQKGTPKGASAGTTSYPPPQSRQEEKIRREPQHPHAVIPHGQQRQAHRPRRDPLCQSRSGHRNRGPGPHGAPPPSQGPTGPENPSPTRLFKFLMSLAVCHSVNLYVFIPSRVNSCHIFQYLTFYLFHSQPPHLMSLI